MVLGLMVLRRNSVRGWCAIVTFRATATMWFTPVSRD